MERWILYVLLFHSTIQFERLVFFVALVLKVSCCFFFVIVTNVEGKYCTQTKLSMNETFWTTTSVFSIITFLDTLWINDQLYILNITMHELSILFMIKGDDSCLLKFVSVYYQERYYVYSIIGTRSSLVT